MILVEASLDEMPLFVRENTVIPMWKKAGINVVETRKSGLEFRVYGEKADSKGMLYLDDGLSKRFHKGEYGLYSLNSNVRCFLLGNF